MKSFTIQHSGYHLRYHDLPGEDTPIIFIHGLGCAGSFDFPNLASQEQLTGHRRILIDLLGSGFSDKPEDFSYTIQDHANYLLSFIEHLGLKKFILFGHSIGGAIALTLAKLCEEQVETIILGEANLDAGGGSTSKSIAAFSYEDFVRHGFNSIISSNIQNGNDLWAASFSLCSPKAMYATSRAAINGGQPSWREMLYSLTCPKTFIVGEYSAPDPDEIHVLQEHGVRVDILANTGHSMTWGNPEGLAITIKNAISK
ncbi:Haloalkane dehalogenase [compost metagenome]